MSYTNAKMTPEAADPLSGIVARWVIFMFVQASGVGAIFIGGRSLAIRFVFEPVLFVVIFLLFCIFILLLSSQFQRA